jgi:eIF3 subunit 6 N terminal domain
MTTMEGVEQWDLTSRVSPYLDRHMMFPLLEYLDSLINAGTVSYSSKDVATSRLSLLRPTHMVDYAIDIYKGLHGEDSTVPPEMEEQKVKVYERLEELRVGCEVFDKLCRNDGERVRKLDPYYSFYPVWLSCLFMSFHGTSLVLVVLDFVAVSQ